MGVYKTYVIPSVLMLIFMLVYSQACDTDSEVAQCSNNEICVENKCQTAVRCSIDADCNGFYKDCLADYCQPVRCTATGECVHGHICSQDITRTCVYPDNLKAEEKSRFLLNFSEPGTGGTYDEITWYKGNSIFVDRIVLVNPTIEGGILYYGDYCSGSSPCETSDKVELNLDTGTLTIRNVELSDEDYYYYSFYIDGGSLNTGNKYEIKLEVYVTPTEISIEGIPDSIVEVGTELDLKCTVNQIKPEAAEIFWTISGVRENGSLKTHDNGNGTFKQTNEFTYAVAKEDEEIPIECTVVPVHGTQIHVGKTVNPGYGPSGKPEIEPSSSEKYAGEKVELICKKPVDVGNPNCDIYTWNKEGSSETFPNSQTIDFIMEESKAGNYTCTCGNDFDVSDVSNKARVIFLAGTAPTESGVSMAVIGGAIGGAVFVILIVVIVIFIIRRKRKPPKAKPDDEARPSTGQNGLDQQGPIYAQPQKNRKLRPHRGLENGPEYANANELKGDNPYQNTEMQNNNPPNGKQENGNPEGVVYTEINVGPKGTKPDKPGKPTPKERSSVKKPKTNVHQGEEPTVYAEIAPVKKDEQK